MSGCGPEIHPAYQPEIDGIRALAVISVILYHADPRWLPGGLAGVDVFFVISGYLITDQIIAGLAGGTFSLAGFWSRRLRRIVPALLLVLSCSCLPAVWLLPPDQLKAFGMALMTSVLPLSNIYLRHLPGGYFAADSQLSPLIHMWSLAVEEQFYLCYPIVLLGIYRIKPRWLPAIFALGLALSAAMAAILIRHRPEAAFYYLPPRAWELMVGGAVAMYRQRSGSALPAGPLRRLLIWPALAALLAAFLLPGTRDSFPWPAALLPCLGTGVLLALLQPADGVSRLLAARPVAAIGMISYSLYLWHQPAFAFARIASIDAIPLSGYIAITGALLPLSWASWRFVEQPLRHGSRMEDRRAFMGMAAVGAVLMMAGFAAWATDGWKSRFSPQALSLMALPETSREARIKCRSDDEAHPMCPDMRHWPPQIAVLGDSHAEALSEGLTPLADRKGAGIVTLWKPGCPPLLGRTIGDKTEAGCMHFMAAAANRIAATPSVRKVILAARWGWHVELATFDNGEGGVEPAYQFDAPPPDARAVEAFGDGLLAMVVRLQNAGKKVVIVGPIPEAGWSVPDYLWKSARMGRTIPPTTSLARFEQRQARSLAMLRRVAARSKVEIVHPERAFCSPATRRCRDAEGMSPFYTDDDHVSPLGAGMIVQQNEAALLRLDP